MVYFPYGWPRTYSAEYGRDEHFFYLHEDSSFLIAVSPSSVHLWTSGLQRILVSQTVRTVEDVNSDGVYIGAFWSPARSTLAVVVRSLLISSVCKLLADPHSMSRSSSNSIGITLSE